MIRKTIICAAMLGIVVLAIASTGGGKKKSSSAPLSSFAPIRSTGTFTLRSNPAYSGSHSLSSQNSKNFTVVKSLVTYQKGNTTYVVPAHYKINTASRLSFKSNLNMLDLKIRICK